MTYYEKQLERIAKDHGLPEYQYVQLRQSRAFMEKYYAEKIELEEIAAAAFMSRSHYIRIFRKVYGVSPRKYLRDLRISKAKDLLKKGISVTQVCFDIGYESLPTFSSAFKRGTGYSPAVYQKIYFSNRE